MTDDSAAGLRSQAARCRRLAAVTYDQRTYASLIRSADEFENEAAARDADGGTDGVNADDPGI